MFWPLILFVQAEACGRSGRPAEGLGLLEEALEIADQGSGLTLLPGFYSLKATCCCGYARRTASMPSLGFNGRSTLLGNSMPR